MIELRNLTYNYRRDCTALDDVTANIGPGIHLLLGENGAGKTTLLRLMAGLLFPTSGRCIVDDSDISRRLPSGMKNVFFLSDNMEITTKTIREFALLHSRFYPTFSQEKFDENLFEFGLKGNENYNQLSLGMRHKSLLAYVIALGVDVLLLDEPANGLDITSKKALRHALARCIDPEQTVIVSTHTVSDLRELYDSLIILSKSKLLLSAPTWEIAERISCVSGPVPPEDSIYIEQGAGLFHSIQINDTGEPADLNYALLYSALMSPVSDRILEILRRPL